jgi:hypothetical protein
MTTPSTTTKEHQMTTIQLTPAQHAIIAYAIEHTGGKIEWFPDNIKGGARTKVLESLFNKALITRDSTDWFVAAEGYDALGRARPTPAALHPDPDPEVEAAVSAAEANWAQENERSEVSSLRPKQDAAKRLLKVGVEGKPRTRENERSEVSRGEAERARSTRQNSKQAAVIQMLQRPEGATINQICAATGWQAHTVRGTFAGAFKKKLGLTITSEKPEGGERIYRVG